MASGFLPSGKKNKHLLPALCICCMQGAICMCRHQQGAIALLALGLGILIGTVCSSTWLSIVLILGCFGLGCLCQKK